MSPNVSKSNRLTTCKRQQASPSIHDWLPLWILVVFLFFPTYFCFDLINKSLLWKSLKCFSYRIVFLYSTDTTVWVTSPHVQKNRVLLLTQRKCMKHFEIPHDSWKCKPSLSLPLSSSHLLYIWEHYWGLCSHYLNFIRCLTFYNRAMSL